MSFDKLLANILKYQLVYGAVGIELINIFIGWCLGLGTWPFITTGILTALPFVFLSIKNKIAINEEILLVEEYKSQNKILIEALSSCAEAMEDQDFAYGLWNQLIQDSVFPILQELNFIQDPGIRVSLYTQSKKGFTLLYRHADNPDFQRKGRAIYPSDEGIIGNAYHKNESHVSMLPDPNINEEEWIKAQMDSSKGGMKNRAVVKNLTMKSRNLFALPIRNGHEKHIVIVFESIKDNELNIKLIKKSINNHHGLKLKWVLSMYKTHMEPSLSYADKMGV